MFELHVWPRIIRGLRANADAAILEGCLRAQTYVALVGLTACTGLRISKVLRLIRANAGPNQGIPKICETKFRKTQLVPLHRLRPPNCSSMLLGAADLRQQPSAAAFSYPIEASRCPPQPHSRLNLLCQRS